MGKTITKTKTDIEARLAGLEVEMNGAPASKRKELEKKAAVLRAKLDAYEAADRQKAADAEEKKKRAEKDKAEAKAKREAERAAKKQADEDEARRKWNEAVEQTCARMMDVVSEFDGGGSADAAWLQQLDFDGAGMVIPSLMNILKIVDGCGIFGSKLRKNELTGMYEWDGKTMSDELENRIFLLIYKMTGAKSRDDVRSAIMETASRNTYHPLLERVEGIVWDGRRRVEDFFIKRLGAEDTPLTREMTFKWFMAMFRRVKSPGCVFDHYLAISDPKQGTGKTKCFEKIVSEIGFPDLISTNLTTRTNDQNNVMNINSVVIGLFDESSQTKYTALEEFKTFVTTPSFKIRLPWGRNITDLKVHCVYAVTTNDDKFLTDTTSQKERRAWVLVCDGNPDRTFEEWDALNNAGEIEQLWAEIVWWHTHQADAPWRIDGNHISRLTPENERALGEVQAAVKTSADDFATNNAVETILTQSYTRDGTDGDAFANAEEFMSDTWQHGEAARTKALKKVRTDWFASYVVKMTSRGGGKARSKKYILQVTQALAESGQIPAWTVKREQNNGVRKEYLVRNEAPEGVKNLQTGVAEKAPEREVARKSGTKPVRDIPAATKFGLDGIDFGSDFDEKTAVFLPKKRQKTGQKTVENGVADDTDDEKSGLKIEI